MSEQTNLSERDQIALVQKLVRREGDDTQTLLALGHQFDRDIRAAANGRGGIDIDRVVERDDEAVLEKALLVLLRVSRLSASYQLMVETAAPHLAAGAGEMLETTGRGIQAVQGILQALATYREVVGHE